MNDSFISPSTALLVVDVQRGLFRKSTPIYQADSLLSNISRLVAAARQAGALPIFIQHSSEKNLVFGSDDWQIHLGQTPARRPADL